MANTIRVYANERTQTSENHASAQGFGYSTPLETPKGILDYVWEGVLYHSGKDVTRSSNSRKTLDELAINLVLNITYHPLLRNQPAKLTDYNIAYEKGELPIGSGEPRNLNLAEQRDFSNAFERLLTGMQLDEKIKREKIKVE
jgi:hypothetical protein